MSNNLKEFKIEYTEETACRIYIKAKSKKEAEDLFFGRKDGIDWDDADIITSDFTMDNIEEV